MIKFFIHIILAFSVFISSSGIWITSHYCQNELKKTSFFFNFGSCCEKGNSDLCTFEKMVCSKEEHEKKNCCHNKPSFHKIDQNQLIQEAKFKSFEGLDILTADIPAINIELPVFGKLTPCNFNYKPPPLVYDRQVWFQTFLC